MMLSFSDPVKLKTKKIIFEGVFHARDSGTLEQLKELSSRRKMIEDSINESSFITEAIAREMAGGLTSKIQRDLQKMDFYLPLLENLIMHVEQMHDNNRIIRWIADLKIQWTSSLSESSAFLLRGPKIFRINNLRFELGMSIYLYAAMLRERAYEMMSEDLVESTMLFRKAAGVYVYLAEDVLPPLQPLLSKERPAESISSVSSVMSLICLAEAQAVTIKKAEQRKGSSSVLSKLHYGITQMLSEAASLLNSNAGELNDVSERLVDFVSICSLIHQLKSQRHFAEGLMIGNHVGTVAGHRGMAIAIMRYAIASVKGVRQPKDDFWRSTLNREVSCAREMLWKFESDNENIYRDKIPDHDQLPSLQGVKMVEPIRYEPQRWERELDFLV